MAEPGAGTGERTSLPPPKRAALAAASAFVAGGIALASIWAPPLLVTNDGPSHVYNAALGYAVETGRPPFPDLFRVARGVRPQMASHTLLVALGPRVGWEPAERVVVTLAVVGTFAVLLWLIAPAGPLVAALLAPLAGWLATSWFIWMGFYDFSLSIPIYLGLLIILSRPLTPLRHALLQLSFGGLYLTHFFTFAAGIGLVAASLGWDAVTGRGSWRRLVIVVPAAAWLVVEMAAGGPGTGALKWNPPWDQLVGLATGDFLVIAHPLDMVAGVTMVLALIATVALRWRGARSAGRGALSGTELFGMALLLLSLLAPHSIGEGGFIPIRMRFLGALALWPGIAAAARGLPGARLAVPAAVVLLALAAHTAYLIKVARFVHRDVVLIDRMLTHAGAGEGAWVTIRFHIYRRGLWRVAGYRHVLARIAMHRHLIVLDNYEALYGIFPTTWGRRPDLITFRPSLQGLTVRLIPGAIPWAGPLYVLHEREWILQIADDRLELGPSVVAGPFAVTAVRRRR